MSEPDLQQNPEEEEEHDDEEEKAVEEEEEEGEQDEEGEEVEEEEEQQQQQQQQQDFSGTLHHKIARKVLEMLENVLQPMDSPDFNFEKREVKTFSRRQCEETFSGNFDSINWDYVRSAYENISTLDCRQLWKEAAYGMNKIGDGSCVTSYDSDEVRIRN